MNKILTSLFLLSSSCCIQAQTLSPQVIASAGGFFNASGHSLSFTIGQPASSTLVMASHQLSQGFQQPELDLRTGPVNDSVCAGTELDIPFYSTGYIGSNNEFTAQLSDASGSFASPVDIGSITGNSTDTIYAIVPGSTPAGSNYKVRVVSNLPTRLSNGMTSVTIQLCDLDLSLFAFLEGFYTGGGMTSPLFAIGATTDPTLCDTVMVELHEDSSPFGLLHAETAVLRTDGSIQCNLPSSMINNDYYIVLKTRNGIEIWSKFPVSLGTSTVFDFRY